MEFNGTFLASIISFLTFVYLMNKLLYAPMEKIVQARKIYIEENYDAAEINHNKADEILMEKDEKLDEAREKARKSYVSTVNDYKKQSDLLIKEAQEKSEKRLISECENLKNLSNQTKDGLKARLNDLAGDIAEKVLGYRPQIEGFDDDTVNSILYQEEG